MGSIVKKIFFIVVLAFALLGGCSLFNGQNKDCELIDTIVATDTVFVEVKGSYATYVPKSSKEYVTLLDTIYLENRMVVVEEKELTAEDTLEILSDYYTKREYSDTLSTEYGDFVINDVLWKNNIYSRSYDYNFQIPEITTTIEKTIKQKGRRIQAYLGGSTAIHFNDWSEKNMLSLQPSLYVGAGYRFSKNHSVYYERDFARKDNRFTYKYVDKKLNIFTTYSSELNYFQIGTKFYILK